MKKALVPGSFDPITVGHMDIIKRAAAMFDMVYVTVFVNPNKTPYFSLEERERMIRAACSGLQNVTVDSERGLLADYCRDNGIRTVVKGARSSSDFDYEKEMAQFNGKRNPGLETIILFASDGLEDISSTNIRTLIGSNGNYEKFIPPGALSVLQKLLEKKSGGSR